MPSLSPSRRSDGSDEPFTTAKYMQRPPTIVPNYGRKKKSLLPKSCISRVLLYDNVMQQQMLNVKLKNLKLEKSRTGKLLDLHKKSFVLRQSHKKHLLKNVSRVPGPEPKAVLPPICRSGHSQEGLGRIRLDIPRNRSLPDTTLHTTDELIDGKRILQTNSDEIALDEHANEISLPELIESSKARVEVRKNGEMTTAFFVRAESIPENVLTDFGNQQDDDQCNDKNGEGDDAEIKSLTQTTVTDTAHGNHRDRSRSQVPVAAKNSPQDGPSNRGLLRTQPKFSKTIYTNPRSPHLDEI